MQSLLTPAARGGEGTLGSQVSRSSADSQSAFSRDSCLEKATWKFNLALSDAALLCAALPLLLSLFLLFHFSHQIPQTPRVWQREIKNQNSVFNNSLYLIFPCKTVTHLLNRAENIPGHPRRIWGKKTPGFPLEGDVVKLKWDERIPRAGMGLEEGNAAAFWVQNIPHSPPGTLRGKQGPLQNYRLFSSSSLVNQKIKGKTNSVCCFL